MEEDQLHSFEFCEAIDGAEHSYRITEQANHTFGVEKDGHIIAELANDQDWKQTSGEPLPKALIEKIGDKIEDHYD